MIRGCGGCTLCCKLLPVKALAKGAGVKCAHQKAGKGCRVYHQPEKGFPLECGYWNCGWLVGDAPEGRPDRLRYVIDILPDTIAAHDEEKGEALLIPVVQVWCDPDAPMAWNNDEFKTWLVDKKHGYAVIVRFDNVKAIVVIPPYMNTERKWIVHETAMVVQEGVLNKIRLEVGRAMGVVQ